MTILDSGERRSAATDLLLRPAAPRTCTRAADCLHRATGQKFASRTVTAA